MLKLNQGLSGIVKRTYTFINYFSAERSSHLIVETETRVQWCGAQDYIQMFLVQKVIDGSQGGARDVHLLGVKLLSILYSFWINLVKSYVGTPKFGKSWINH